MSALDKMALRSDIIASMLGHENGELQKSQYMDHLVELAELEQSEHQTLVDPFDRSIAIVLQMFNDDSLDPWHVDLSKFITLFKERISAAENIDLPTCGRLIRLAWGVLHGQAATLMERQERADAWDEDPWAFDSGWETEFEDDDFAFTNRVLSGQAADALPNLFDGRIKRDAGRPVTLGELLLSLSDAHEEAAERQLREENRKRYQIDVQVALANVKSRVHDDDIEDDIRRCWNALRSLSSAGEPVTVGQICELLQAEGEAAGWDAKEAEREAKVAGFVSALFLTHRGYTDIWQLEQPNGDIFLQDKWPEDTDFDSITVKLDVRLNGVTA